VVKRSEISTDWGNAVSYAGINGPGVRPGNARMEQRARVINAQRKNVPGSNVKTGPSKTRECVGLVSLEKRLTITAR
jgi:hypothetical protein